jgi:hypothetical protein
MPVYKEFPVIFLILLKDFIVLEIFLADDSTFAEVGLVKAAIIE